MRSVLSSSAGRRWLCVGRGVLTEEEVVGMRAVAAYPKDFNEIVELPEKGQAVSEGRWLNAACLPLASHP